MVSVLHMSNGCNNLLVSSQSLLWLHMTRQADEIHILQVIFSPSASLLLSSRGNCVVSLSRLIRSVNSESNLDGGQ